MTGRVVVVGGGVVGCAVARELADDREVVVLERDRVAGGATGRAAGLVTVATAYVDHPGVAEAAIEGFRSFDGTAGFSFQEVPSLEHPAAATDPGERAERLRAGGVDATHLDAAEARERHPRLAIPDRGVVRVAPTGWVVPDEFAYALQTAATDRGATVRTGVTVTDLTTDDGAVTGVATTDGHVEADAVVAAAGWRTPDLLADRVALPSRPYRTQCVVVDAGADLADLPMGWLVDEDVYWRPTRDGNLLVGGGSAFANDPESASGDEDPSFRRRVVDVVPDVLADVEDAAYVRGWAGVDAATPDAFPLVDAPGDGPDGLVVATGLHGRGIMTAFPVADAVAGLLAGDPPPAPFRLDRFDDRSTDFEFHSVSA